MLKQYWLGRQFREEGDAGGEGRETPAQMNARRNAEQLNRRQRIADGADRARARELEDTDGQTATGRFQDGELDDSPEARERAAELEEQAAAQAIADAEREAAEREESAAAEEARRLQGEGGDGDAETGRRAASPASGDDDDQKVIDGVTYYRTMVGGQERWLTLKQLRTSAGASAQAEETLQRAQAALKESARAALTPKEEPAAELDDSELENVLLSAVMGDTEAVKKLVPLLKAKAKQGANPADVSRVVSQQIATQRLVDTAEAAESDLLDDPTLGPIFRQRLSTLARETPEMKIDAAYQSVGKGMRKDFAPMIKRADGAPASKADRKRTLVTPPASAGRTPAIKDEEREEPVSSQIDAIAKSRGQERAIRQGRR